MIRLACALSLGMALTSVNAQDQAKLERACNSEIDKAERSIREARQKPQYQSAKGRQTLTAADRYLNQARQYAAKGESRSCAAAAKKGRAQIAR
jgi:hypothetical protein